MDDDLVLLSANHVSSLLRGLETELITIVKQTYELHNEGVSVVPHSLFLRLPNDSNCRFIALPAYCGGRLPRVGLKWIASFPGNVGRGKERASAVIIINSTETGMPVAILEGSIVSAKRTAASAMLAAIHLHQRNTISSLGLVGCGRINYEVAKFARVVLDVKNVILHDIDSRRMRLLADHLASWDCRLQLKENCNDVLSHCEFVSFATTAASPYVQDISMCPRGATLLNLSLRDLSPEAVLAADNVVDDVDHVCRERTSIHLTSMRRNDCDFIRCTLGQVLAGKAMGRTSEARPILFSPFGLGILDVAVASFVVHLAVKGEIGDRISGFHPEHWAESHHWI